MENSLVPFTVHIKDGVFLAEPERIFIRCNEIQARRTDVFRYIDPIGSFDPYATVCVETEDAGVLPMVCNTALIDVSAFTITYQNQNFSNKYFTPELFRNYLISVCCNCDTGCDDTCFLLLNGCTAQVNHQGLLI